MQNSNFKISLKKWDLASADERRKPILEDVIKKNGQIPNMYANMINSPGVLETYLHGYNAFRGESGFTPVEQEVVFLTLSYENACDYCMAAHSFIADKMSKVPEEVTNAIREGRKIEDEKLQALSAFTKEMFQTRGRPNADAVDNFFQAGYDERKMLEIVLALAVKTLSNYSNHLFDTEVDPMFQGRSWTSPKK
jgi:AhpD family alkylhydroperoxidase